MDKNTLLKLIAETGYNVGFGAKTHFATYDIVEKAPGWISLLSFAVAIFALFIDNIANNKYLAATLIIMGVAGMYITFYNDKKETYEKNGVEMTKQFNSLKILYQQVKNSSSTDFTQELAQLKQIENDFYSITLSKQIFLSDWYAHIKFFWQHQIEWIDEQKKFTLLRDKIPLSAHATIALLILLGVYHYLPNFSNISKIWCH
ncbi:SLATT domain-containing protein [Chromobacterium violaceum]|uniref:SLATT domain-containing protein n=1 Tax=Chromobacterium violaceum TaxID=536 RepID=UPI001B33425D|nr:SLATT domain-containing protein [Chromobacterium violaceum]MBP4047106.1 SLATT domain-containing protein [Chromobacterium violaceum]